MQGLTETQEEELISWGKTYYYNEGDVVPDSLNDYLRNSLRKALGLLIPTTSQEREDLEHKLQEALEFLELRKWEIIEKA